MSKNDTFEEQDRKIHEYLEAGTPVAWLVDPKNEVVYVYDSAHPDGEARTGEDVIEHPDVLPGFRCEARELFAS